MRFKIALLIILSYSLKSQMGFINSIDSLNFIKNKKETENTIFSSFKIKHKDFNGKFDSTMTKNLLHSISRIWHREINYLKYNTKYNDSIYDNLINKTEIAYLYGFENDTLRKTTKMLLMNLYASKFMRLYFYNSKGDTTSFNISKSSYLLTEEECKHNIKEYYLLYKLYHDDFINPSYRLYIESLLGKTYDVLIAAIPSEFMIFNSEYNTLFYEIQNEKITKQRNIIIGFISLIFILLILMIFLFRNRNTLLKKVVASNKEIEEQKHLIEEKQKEVMDSIRYARRIQTSLLPTEKYIDKVIKNSTKKS